MLESDNEQYQGHDWIISQLLSAATQGVTYIILTDCTYSCPSLSNYTYILYYITPSSIRYSPHGE